MPSNTEKNKLKTLAYELLLALLKLKLFQTLETPGWEYFMYIFKNCFDLYQSWYKRAAATPGGSKPK